MAKQAWELGFYDLFLLWSGQLLIFATPVTIRCSRSLSTVMHLLVAFYFHSKTTFRVQDLMIQVLTEDILQTVGVGATEFMDDLHPVKSADASSHPTKSAATSSHPTKSAATSSHPTKSTDDSLPPADQPLSTISSPIHLFLLQSFSDAYGDLLVTATTVAGIGDGSREISLSSLPDSARKIRPRDVDVAQGPGGTDSLFSADDRSLRLLDSYAALQTQEYQMIRSIILLLLQKEGAEMASEECIRKTMKKQYDAYAYLVEAITSDCRSPLDADAPSNDDSSIQALQLQVERIVLKEVCECVSSRVCEETKNALVSLSVFRAASSVS